MIKQKQPSYRICRYWSSLLEPRVLAAALGYH